jgi:hypothetical protein
MCDAISGIEKKQIMTGKILFISFPKDNKDRKSPGGRKPPGLRNLTRL